MDVTESIPESGAVFTFGSSKLTGNTTSCFWLKNDVIVSASCGDEHVALVTEKGKVYVFGSNNWGQLGLGSTHPSKKPACVKMLRGCNATMVACGRNHTLVCTSDDQIFAFGNNSDFQIGAGEISNSNVPARVKTDTCGKIKQIAAGADFSILLNNNGQVYAWGSNAEGQLGLGNDVNEADEPMMIQRLEQIQHVACGYYHTALVSTSGKLYTFGEDEFGKLGERINSDTSVPSTVKVPESVRVAKVACGGSHTAFISETGEVYTFGGGSHGELGHGGDSLQILQATAIERLKNHEIVHISCGENFTSAITKKGRLYTFGDGRHGKLAGDEENFTNQFQPFRCKRFKKFTVGFAICGGCHMVVSATSRQGSVEDTDSENDDPMQTIVDRAFVKKSDMHLTEKPNGQANGGLGALKTAPDLSRSLSAREKRRQDREKVLSQTLPPLRSLNTDELLKAAKSLPKPSALHQSISNEWPDLSKKGKAKDPDDVSEISAFNKVHKLVKVGNLDSFVPVVKQSGIESESVGEEETTDGEDDDIESVKNNDVVQDIAQNGAESDTLESQMENDRTKMKASDMKHSKESKIGDEKIAAQAMKNTEAEADDETDDTDPNGKEEENDQTVEDEEQKQVNKGNPTNNKKQSADKKSKADRAASEDNSKSTDDKLEQSNKNTDDHTVEDKKENPTNNNKQSADEEPKDDHAASDGKSKSTDVKPQESNKNTDQLVSKVEEQTQPQGNAAKTKGTKKSKLCTIL